MGRQIQFFMDKKTEEIFVVWLRKNFLLINLTNQPYNFEEENNMCCCYKKEYGSLIYRKDNGKINILESPVIEFTRTVIKEKNYIRGKAMD